MEEKEVLQKIDFFFPKKKKIVDAVMKKYYGNKYYRKIDLINKVINKCKLKNTMKEKNSIRRMINTWIRQNEEESESDISEDEKPAKLPPLPQAIRVKDLQPPLLIDLTVEHEIKKEEFVDAETKEIKETEKNSGQIVNQESVSAVQQAACQEVLLGNRPIVNLEQVPAIQQVASLGNTPVVNPEPFLNVPVTQQGAIFYPMYPYNVMDPSYQLNVDPYYRVDQFYQVNPSMNGLPNPYFSQPYPYNPYAYSPY